MADHETDEARREKLAPRLSAAPRARGVGGTGRASAVDGTGELDEPALLERGRWLFAQDCRFVASAATLDRIPAAHLPEVAFAGRSNVGKSSLLNALAGRKALARTSKSPGRTRAINFFALAERLLLADLPGYGYSEAPKDEARAWGPLVRDYVRGRPNLRRVLLLIDCRHGAGAADRAFMEVLDQAAVSYQVVLTKADKLGDQELMACLAALEGELSGRAAAHPRLIVTSARSGRGLGELRAELARLAGLG